MNAAVRVVALSRLKDSPEKEKLVFWGEWSINNTTAKTLDNGTHATISVKVPARRPKGRFIPPRKVYQ